MYLMHGVLGYLPVVVVSAVLECFLHTYQIQCVSGLLIFELDTDKLFCHVKERDYQVLKTLEAFV